MTIERTSARHQVREMILERISSGRYRPGERLLEMQLAQEFGVSQAPVREALRELEAMNLVETVPYRGTRVREFDRKQTLDAFITRAALEQMAAELAAKNPQVSPKELVDFAMKTIEAIQRSDLDAYVQANQVFHRALVRASGNTVLMQMWESLNVALRWSVSANMSKGNEPAIAADHLAIAEAIQLGDSAQAVRAVRSHYDRALKGLQP